MKSPGLVLLHNWKRCSSALCLLVILSCSAMLAGCSRPPEENARGIEPADAVSLATSFGTYHALLIGIDGYEQWPPLRFAEADALDIGELLESEYGFDSRNVTRLVGEDATRSRILGALREKLETLGESDNLLIYYAGHGQLDPLTESGYWVPIDGDLYDDSSWIPFTTITSYLAAANVQAKNVVVITDSCYGGALARSGPTPGNPRPGVDVERYVTELANLAAKRSRHVIASGGYEQVPDQSLFAALLKEALRENEYPAVDLELLFFSQIYPQLRIGGQQEAIMSRVVAGPETSGQFVLLRAQAGEEAPAAPARVSVESDPAADRVLVDGEPRGTTPAALQLTAGRHVIRVEREGFLPFEEELVVSAAEERVVRARLEREQALVPTATLEIEPLEVRAGERFTLTWRTENADRAEISSLGAVPLSGSRELIAEASGRYELTATGPDGQRASTSRELRVQPALPTIDYFIAKPEEIEAGQAATLAWRVSDAEVVYIEGYGSVEASGLQDFRPAMTTTYLLTATNGLKESIQQSVTVTVKPVPAPSITSFGVEPATIPAGQTAHLSWQASGERASLSGIGPVPVTGSYAVTPTATTTYTLSVQNAAGQVVESTATVTVPRVVNPDIRIEQLRDLTIRDELLRPRNEVLRTTPSEESVQPRRPEVLQTTPVERAIRVTPGQAVLREQAGDR